MSLLLGVAGDVAWDSKPVNIKKTSGSFNNRFISSFAWRLKAVVCKEVSQKDKSRPALKAKKS